jgi:DNA repair protein RadC
MHQYEKLTIKQLATEDRPREKVLQKGLSSLSEAELLAILLGSGSAKESAVELARKILAAYHNNLNQLGKAGIDELKNNFHGVGEAKAITIIAAMELGRRRRLQESLEMPAVRSSNDAYQILQPILGHLPHEEFWILMLNRSNRILTRYNVSKGGLTGTVIDVRLILKKALESHAASMILSHNHPSGNKQPSGADQTITRKLTDAGQIMDIPVIDHIIIAENDYFSFADEGML